MFIKGDIDSNQKIVGNGLVLNVDAAQYRSLPRGGDIVTSGLVLNLDAGNPSSYSGTGTTWYDISGNGQSATLSNFTYNTTNGGVLVANGSTSSGVGGFISTSIINTNKLTSEVWVYFTSTGGAYQRFLTTTNQASEISIIRLNSGVITFYVFTSSGLQTLTASSVSANTWYHIVGTWDGTTMRVYVNGSLAASGVRSGTLINATIGPVYIISSSGESLNGYIPIARYYNRDLSAAEVTQNYDALKFRYGLISGPPGTISPINTTDLFIHLDANNTSSYPGSGTRFYDLSGNGNYFDLQNGSYFDNSAVKSVFLDGADDYAISNQGVQAGSGNYTFSVWFKNDNYSENKFILTRGRDGVQYGWSLYIVALSDGRAQIGCAVWFPATAGFSTPSTTVMALNTWYYITGVFTDGVGIKVYVNGVYENQASTNGYYGLRPNWSPDGWYLGTVNTSNFTSGYVAAVDVYRRALSDAEILNNFNAVKSRYGYTNPPTWYDISGYGNNGTLTNGPTLNLNNGGSIVFDGTNDYVNAGSLNLQQNWTLEAWVNMSDSSFFGLFGQGTTFTNQGFHIYYTNGPNGMVFAFYSNDANYTNNYRPSTGVWYHWVFTYNSTTYAKQFYANGILQTPTSITQNIYQGSGQFNIGAVYSSPIGFANGRIAITRMYNKVLSATEVLNNFNAVKSRFGYGLPVIASGLQLYLSSVDPASNPGSGTAWNDISGNGRNFTWVSTPTRGTDTGVPYFQTLGNRCTGPASNSFGINNTSGYTIFLIMKQQSLVQTGAFKFYSSVAGGRGIFSHCTWSDDNIYFDQGGCCNADQRTNAASGGLTAWNIMVFRSTVATRSIFKNATSLITNSTSAANINLTTTAADLASSDEYGGNSSTWDARIAGFLVYNRGLSDAEISQNIQILRSQFGM